MNAANFLLMMMDLDSRPKETTANAASSVSGKGRSNPGAARSAGTDASKIEKPVRRPRKS